MKTETLTKRRVLVGPSGQTYKVSRGGRGGKTRKHQAQAIICPHCDRPLTIIPGDSGKCYPHKCY